MSGSADDRNIDPSTAPEVSGQTAPQKVEHIEAGHQPKIGGCRNERSVIFSGQHQPQAGLCPHNHYRRHKQAEDKQQFLSLAESFPHPAGLSRPGVLSDKDGHCRRAAVAERVGESLNPGRGGKGDDSVIA